MKSLVQFVLIVLAVVVLAFSSAAVSQWADSVSASDGSSVVPVQTTA